MESLKKINKELKKLQCNFIDIATKYDEEFTVARKTTMHEIETLLLNEKILLLEAICKDNNMDINICKQKYLNINIQPKIKETKTNVILSTTILNGKKYYYENIKDGKVYNEKSEYIGNMTNGIIQMFD
jgi:hypothetical protein